MKIYEQQTPNTDMSFSEFSTTFLNPNTNHEESDFDFDFDSAHPHRYLAGGDPNIDFTALSMAVVTMSLLMIVAILRHKIDHLARGKEFFENVLEAAYHECKFTCMHSWWIDLFNCIQCDIYNSRALRSHGLPFLRDRF